MKFKKVIPAGKIILTDTGDEYWVTKIPSKTELDKRSVILSVIPDNNAFVDTGVVGKSVIGHNFYARPFERMIVVKTPFVITYGSPKHALIVEVSELEKKWLDMHGKSYKFLSNEEICKLGSR